MKKWIVLEHHPNDSRIKIVKDDICQSLSARMGTGGNNVPLVLQIDEDEDVDRKEILSVVEVKYLSSALQEQVMRRNLNV